MSDQVIDTRKRDGGDKDDRRLSTAQAAAGGAAAGLTIGMCDWVFLQCLSTGHWHWVTPSKDLIEVSAPIIVLPIALWFARAIGLVGDIIMNRLQRDAA